MVHSFNHKTYIYWPLLLHGPELGVTRTRSHVSSGSKDDQGLFWGHIAWHFPWRGACSSPSHAHFPPDTDEDKDMTGLWWPIKPVWGCESLRSEDGITLSSIPTASVIHVIHRSFSWSKSYSPRRGLYMAFRLVWNCLWASVFWEAKLHFERKPTKTRSSAT